MRILFGLNETFHRIFSQKKGFHQDQALFFHLIFLQDASVGVVGGSSPGSSGCASQPARCVAFLIFCWGFRVNMAAVVDIIRLHLSKFYVLWA